MAKKKHKAKNHLPKRIAGVKVPKSVRQGRFGQLLASRTGQLLIAEAIMVAGAAAGAKKGAKETGAGRFLTDAARHLQDRGDMDKALGPAGGAIAYAVGEAVRSFADALRSGEPNVPDDHGVTEPGWDAAADMHDGAAQKKSPSRSATSPP